MIDSRTAEIQRRSFYELLQNHEAVRFVHALIKDSYQAVFQGHAREVGEMVDRAWALLEVGAGRDPGKLGETVTRINRDIFRKQDPAFWFNSLYSEYKIKTKPQKIFSNLQPFLSGKRILDFGSGGGTLALVVSQHGYSVTTTDVIDYRVKEARHLPFRAMVSPTDIPYPDESFDTAIVKAVLHHVDESDLPTILKELRRVSSRLIVEEDTFDVHEDTPGLQQLSATQPDLGKFLSLRREDQLQALMLIDYFSNAITQGLVEMNFPFQFKTIPQWQRLFDQHGLKLAQVKLLGFQEGNVSKSCHVWLIADRKENAPDG